MRWVAHLRSYVLNAMELGTHVNTSVFLHNPNKKYLKTFKTHQLVQSNFI